MFESGWHNGANDQRAAISSIKKHGRIAYIAELTQWLVDNGFAQDEFQALFMARTEARMVESRQKGIRPNCEVKQSLDKQARSLKRQDSRWVYDPAEKDGRRTD